MPDYVADWLISRYTVNGQVNRDGIAAFLAKHLPNKRHKESLKLELSNGGTLKLLDSYSARVDIEADKLYIDLPSLDIYNASVEKVILEQHPLLLLGNVWGSGTVVRRPKYDNPDRYEIAVIDFKPMQTSIVDLDYYIKARNTFSDRQWREMLIRSIGLDPEAYSVSTATGPIDPQVLLLLRLAPLVQPRLNLIELAPKGTGKSYVFSKLSRYAWLISGGTVTRAQLLYDMGRKTEGVISKYDVVILDEIQTIKLSDEGEIVGSLKGYLEQGEYRVGKFQGTAESGMVLLANIPLTSYSKPKNELLFDTLPKWLRGAAATALLDRFHGLIPGWDLRKIDKECLCNSIALKADYFGEILHALRNRPEYLQWVKAHMASSGNIRDIIAVERIATGLLKLMYPDLNAVTVHEFKENCLEPAKQLRKLIRTQMALADEEYSAELADIQAVGG